MAFRICGMCLRVFSEISFISISCSVLTVCNVMGSVFCIFFIVVRRNNFANFLSRRLYLKKVSVLK